MPTSGYSLQGTLTWRGRPTARMGTGTSTGLWQDGHLAAAVALSPASRAAPQGVRGAERGSNPLRSSYWPLTRLNRLRPVNWSTMRGHQLTRTACP